MVLYPPKFLERLQSIVPAEFYPSVIQAMDVVSYVYRINTLKISIESMHEQLRMSGVVFEIFNGCPEAFICVQPLPDTRCMDEGLVYKQDLSSMLAVVELDPQPQEQILDLCSAPGGKCGFIAQRMRNTGSLIAVESVRDRMFRLRSVLQLLGVQNCQTVFCDGRRFKNSFLFDRVLIDAPCSSEGRFTARDKKSFGFWSERKIKEMVRKQKGLLLNGSRFVKPGGVLLYATCTFAPEENEGVVNWFLKKADNQFDVIPIEGLEHLRLPIVAEWNGRVFNTAVLKSVRFRPTDKSRGFFMAKFRRRAE